MGGFFCVYNLVRRRDSQLIKLLLGENLIKENLIKLIKVLFIRQSAFFQLFTANSQGIDPCED